MTTAHPAPPSPRTAPGPLAHADDEKKNGHDNPPPEDNAGDVLGDEA